VIFATRPFAGEFGVQGPRRICLGILIILKTSAYRSTFDIFHSVHSNFTIIDVYTQEELISQEFTSALEATHNYNATTTHNTTIEMSMEIQSLSNKDLLPLENVSSTNTRAAEQEKQPHWNINTTATLRCAPLSSITPDH